MLPYGETQEAFYEQKLLLKIPFTVDNIGTLISKNNTSKTFMEECVLRNLIDTEKDAMETLHRAVNRGYNIKRIRELAQCMVDNGMIPDSEMGEFLAKIEAERPKLEETVTILVDEAQEKAEMGDMIVSQKESVDLNTYITNFSNRQRMAYDWLENHFKEKKQFMVNYFEFK